MEEPSPIIVPCSTLPTQTFCEYQIWLEYGLGIEAELSEEAKEGKEIHEKLYEEFKKEVEISGGSSSFLEFLANKEEPKKGREMLLGCFLNGNTFLIGRCDEIWSLRDSIVVIDDKPRDFVRKSDIRQVVAYGYIIKQWLKEFKIKKKVKLIVRNEYTGEIVWEDRLRREMISDMLETARRIRDFLIGKTKPIPTKKMTKCLKCRFRNHCDKFIERKEKYEKLKKEVILLHKQGLSERKIAKKLNLTRWEVRKLLGKKK